MGDPLDLFRMFAEPDAAQPSGPHLQPTPLTRDILDMWHGELHGERRHRSRASHDRPEISPPIVATWRAATGSAVPRRSRTRLRVELPASGARTDAAAPLHGARAGGGVATNASTAADVAAGPAAVGPPAENEYRASRA